MRNNFGTLLTTTAVLAALAGGFVLYAYADSPSSQNAGGMMQGGRGGMMQGGMPNMMGQMNPNSRDSGSMMQGAQGGMPNMMGMMGQMSQMMEACSGMMKEMPRHPGPGKPE